MPDTQTTATAIAITRQAPHAAVLPVPPSFIRRIGAWANETAQEFAALVAALMGPAVFSAYAMALWSLSSNLGWTNSFLFASGPLSNWLVWGAIAVSVHAAAVILDRRSTQTSDK